jgi:hypothetical protein
MIPQHPLLPMHLPLQPSLQPSLASNLLKYLSLQRLAHPKTPSLQLFSESILDGYVSRASVWQVSPLLHICLKILVLLLAKPT